MNMKPPSSKVAGLTLVEALICVVILGVLVTMMIPSRSGTVCGGGLLTGTLNNARQLQIATQQMTLDTQANGGNGLEWTMLATKGKTTPVSLAAYFDALVKTNYLSREDLRKLLAMPGQAAPENLTAESISFAIFQFDDRSPSDQPFVVTRNWTRAGLNGDVPPGKKGFVVFTKSGSGGIYVRPAEVKDPKVFPQGTKEGSPYSYVTLR